MSIGDSVLMRFCQQPGKVTRRVLQGADIFRFQVEGTSCEILDLGSLSGEEAHPWFTIKASVPPGEKLGVVISHELARMTGVERLLVSIRGDIWFASDNNFWFFYRFETPG
jgi:hypothetical protein